MLCRTGFDLFNIPWADCLNWFHAIIDTRLVGLQFAYEFNDLSFIAVKIFTDGEGAGYAASSCQTAASGFASPGLSLALNLKNVEQ